MPTPRGGVLDVFCHEMDDLYMPDSEMRPAFPFGELLAATQTAGNSGTDAIVTLGSTLETLAVSEQAPAELLEALLGQVAGERGFVLEIQPESDSKFRVLTSKNCDGEPILNPEEKIVAPLVDRCLDRSAGCWIADLSLEDIAEQLNRSRQPRTKSLLLIPFPDRRMVLYIDHRFQELDLDTTNYPLFGWLFTLLTQSFTSRESQQRQSALEEELREARRELRKRRPAANSKSSFNLPATIQGQDSRGLHGDFKDIVGESQELLEILQLLERVSATDAPILINGESGTGKELVARSIHKNSLRSEAPFVSENCAALAETLLETELFGHVKGAFTGAGNDRPGLFEIANGGTLFLDEIGDTTPGLQKKLLRALQEGVIRRVGGGDLIEVDVRIISATNKDLITEVERGRFREDLYYRLNVISVPLPPLRDRVDDIPTLTQYFVHHFNEETGHEKRVTPELLEALTAYSWPGNIRELQNQLRRVHALSGQDLDPMHLAPQITGEARKPSKDVFSLDEVLSQGSLKAATEALEKQILESCLTRFHGNKAQVCTSLQIPKTTLYAKLKRYGLLDS